MNAERLLPEVDDEAAPFFDAARRGELRIQQCAETGRLIFPPRSMSPWAPHVEPIWTKVSGRGTIWSFVRPHPPLLPWYAERAPYNVILVALDEDSSVRLVGNLLASEDAELGADEPQEIEIGAAVRAVFRRVTADLALPFWVRV